MYKIKIVISIVFYCLILSTLAAQSKIDAKKTPQRIISVGGALTETIYTLGAQRQLIAADTSSYYPLAAKKLPKVGYQRNLSAEGIIALKPDLLILSAEAGPPAVIKQLQTLKLKIIRMEVNRSLKNVYNNINNLAQVLGRKKQAQTLVKKMKKQRRELDRSIQNYKGLSPRVLFMMNHSGRSLLVAGKDTAIDSIFKIAGLRNAITAFSGYKPLTPEAAVLSKADILLLTSISMQRYGNMQNLLRQPVLKLMPAAKRKNVVVMDALLLLGFGPRTLKAASELRQKSMKLL